MLHTKQYSYRETEYNIECPPAVYPWQNVCLLVSVSHCVKTLSDFCTHTYMLTEKGDLFYTYLHMIQYDDNRVHGMRLRL
jgi:hypothetical protein